MDRELEDDFEDDEEIDEIDLDTEDFMNGHGEFSVEADEKFEQHLKRLADGQKERFWYKR